ncbi:MAG: AAA family ATPase [Haloferacaceae archaeon]|nr:AAA family ATPase [Haloferacaceae archaeon]
MDLSDRITRRQQRDELPHLIEEYELVAPTHHLAEPVGRGPTLERLLDHFEPALAGRLPPNGYIHGPQGVGKSALVWALIRELASITAVSPTAIHTSTRVDTRRMPGFVYVDAHDDTSLFAIYRSILSQLVDDAIPTQGIPTQHLAERIGARLRGTAGAVICIDHVDAPRGVDADAIVEMFRLLPNNVSWVAVGESDPAETPLTRYTDAPIRVDPYREQVLIDVLMSRANRGLTPGAVDHAAAREVANWAGGNAHAALAALFIAADRAETAGRLTLTHADLQAGCAGVPDDGVSLSRVMSLPANRQAVLRSLIDLDDEARASVGDATTALATLDLSASTIKRFLYELAEWGILARVQSPGDHQPGRPPSRVEPNFAAAVFRRLYDLRQRG